MSTSAQPDPTWDDVLRAGVHAQRLVAGAVAVGGTVAALYANHRFSADTDHLLPDLKNRFDDVLDRVEGSAEWKTARLNRPVLILGSLNGVPVGFRQQRQAGAITTSVMETPHGPLRVPTLDELIGMKAYLAYIRKATRDFLDFAALAASAGDERALGSLLESDRRFGHLQTTSVALEIAKTLADPRPVDLDSVRLDEYKGLVPAWHAWSKTEGECVRLGTEMGRRLILRRGSDEAPAS